MPLPSLLCFNIDRLHRRALQDQIEELQNLVGRLKSEKENGEYEISTLKMKVAQSHFDLANGSKRRRATSVEGRNRQDNVISRAKSKTSSSVPVSRSPTPIHKLENSNVHGSPKSLPEERSILPISEDEIDVEEVEVRERDKAEPLIIDQQDTFLEHDSGIVQAKFSSEGNWIASYDEDNILRIWNYAGDEDSSASKLNSQEHKIQSLEWDTRSDKILLLGTDNRLIRVYSHESKSVLHEFQMDGKYPRVNQLCYSPVEPVFACSGNPKTSNKSSLIGSLVTWDIKNTSIKATFIIDSSSSKTAQLTSTSPPASIETIKYNHNGQMLVTGDKAGCIRMFDIRTCSPIMDWSLPNATSSNTTGSGAICSALFSFDETSIYAVDEIGELTQWSVHKPGQLISQSKIQGFPPSSPLVLPQPPPPTPSSSYFPTSFRKRTSSQASTRSTQSVPAVMERIAPLSRVPMIAFSPDTEHMICLSGTDGHGVIYQTSTGEPVLHLPVHSPGLTSVDWTTHTGNAVLTASIDGTVKVIKLMKA